MLYDDFLKLSMKEMENVSDEELPEVPGDKLRNNLQYAKCVRRDGELCWEFTQVLETGEEHHAELPMQRTAENAWGEKFQYQLNPETGAYEMKIDVEPAMGDDMIGGYGQRWMDWMEKYYPAKVDYMKLCMNYLTVTRSVQDRAFQYCERLEEQYEKEFPCPSNDWETKYEWAKARAFYTDSDTMRDVVLHAVTTPYEPYE